MNKCLLEKLINNGTPDMYAAFAETVKQEIASDKDTYKPLPPLISIQQRQEYLDALPQEFDVNGNKDCNIYSKSGTLLAIGYNRVVIGDYGAFVEFDKTQVVKQNIKV